MIPVLIRTHFNCTLENAAGCILAEPIYATESMPPFDRSAVDGYAVKGIGNQFTLKGVIETVRIMILSFAIMRLSIYTGGQVPRGADNVYMQEVCTIDGIALIISEVDGPDFIRKLGRHRAGEVC